MSIQVNSLNAEDLVQRGSPTEQENPTINPAAVTETAKAEKESDQPQDDSVNQQSNGKGDQEISKEEIDNAVDVIESFVVNESKKISFSVTEDTAKTVIQIVDRDSNEVIRQIPTQEVLDMASRIQELVDEIGAKTGIFFEETV